MNWLDILQIMTGVILMLLGFQVFNTNKIIAPKYLWFLRIAGFVNILLGLISISRI